MPVVTGSAVMTSTTKSTRFVPSQLNGVDDASQADVSYISQQKPYSVRRDAKRMTVKQTTIDDIIRLTPLNTHKKSLRRSMVPYTSLYNKTLDDESATMMMASSSKVETVCRGYVTRKGLRKRRVTNCPDTSHLSMDGTIKSLTNLSILKPMSYNSVDNLQRQSNGNIFFKPGSQVVNQKQEALLNQTFTAQQRIKKKSLSEVFSSIVNVLESAEVNNTSSEHDNSKDNVVSLQDNKNIVGKVDTLNNDATQQESPNKNTSESKTETPIESGSEEK